MSYLSTGSGFLTCGPSTHANLSTVFRKCPGSDYAGDASLPISESLTHRPVQDVKHGAHTMPSTLPTYAVFDAFRKWINQRAGLDPQNYFNSYSDRDGRAAFRQEQGSIARDGARARKALDAAMVYNFDAEAMRQALDHAFSGRLSWNGEAFDYCTGQYWPTEYRKAAASVLEEYAEIVRPKHAPDPNAQFTTIDAIKAAHYASGGHWFDRSSMRFFRSRVYSQVFTGPGGVFFVSSEADFHDRERFYNVRQFDPATGDVNSFGEFNKIRSKTGAINEARHAARQPAPVAA